MNTLAVIGTQELLIVAIIGLVLFGGSQLPKLARNLGRAQKELQKGLAEGQADASSGADDEASCPGKRSRRGPGPPTGRRPSGVEPSGGSPPSSRWSSPYR